MQTQTDYKKQLTIEMEKISNVKNSLFVGQQLLYPGNPMSKTLEFVNKDKIIELPVFEETQMGITLGLAMTNQLVVTFYPRWDFLICAANQLVNHLDKYKLMTGKNIHVLIRVAQGSDVPLDPGHQHKGNYINEFSTICKNINFYNLDSIKKIKKSYDFAINNKGIHCLVEYAKYY